MRESDLDAVAAIEASFERPWSRQSFEAELAMLNLLLLWPGWRRVVGYGGIW